MDSPLELGHKYRKGDGVPQNHKEAVRLYQLAASQGDSNGEAWLAYSYLKGDGIKKKWGRSISFIQIRRRKRKSLSLQKPCNLLLLWRRCRKGYYRRYKITS